VSHPDLDPSAATPGRFDTTADEETLADDVNYGIADCRKRLRSRRSTLRAQPSPPKESSNVDVSLASGRVGSYAEALAISMSQSSLSRLVECLLEPASTNTPSREESTDRAEAVIT
jgi:hypothetical protein